MKVFVYGTLMSGESNHFFLEERSSKYIRKAVTERGYTLYDLGGFPGMVSGGTGAVMGEVYDVCARTRRRLDQLEGHPQFYRRHIIRLQDGEKVEAYILEVGYTRGCPVIKSGDWRSK